MVWCTFHNKKIERMDKTTIFKPLTVSDFLQIVSSSLAKNNPGLLVQQYYQNTNPAGNEAYGEYFLIKINRSEVDTAKHHTGKQCNLEVLNLEDEKSLHKTKFKIYHDPSIADEYSPDNDRREVIILNESRDSVTFGCKTGTGRVDIYTYSCKDESFNPETQCQAKDLSHFMLLRKQKEILSPKHGASELLQNVRIFRDFVNKDLPIKWRYIGEEKVSIETKVLLFGRYSGYGNNIVDAYRFYIWIKNVGVVQTDDFYTNFSESESRHSETKLSFDVKHAYRNDDYISLLINITCQHPKWSEEHAFHIDDLGYVSKSALHDTSQEIFRSHIRARQKLPEHELKNTLITLHAVDEDSKTVAWVTRDTLKVRNDTDSKYQYKIWKKKVPDDIQELEYPFPSHPAKELEITNDGSVKVDGRILKPKTGSLAQHQ